MSDPTPYEVMLRGCVPQVRPTPELAELSRLMEGCGRAMFDDREWTAPVYADGEVVGGNGANSFEAAFVLDAVAQVLGLDGPSVVYDRLCETDE